MAPERDGTLDPRPDDAPSANPTPPKPLYYVGIGASAGGLEAIEAFFSNMPEETGLAFIVVQHLSPDYKSLMVELLSKRTPMPVHRAEEGLEVQPNSVYLIPPKTDLRIDNGFLHLSEQMPQRGIQLPIDIFLESLAEDQGERAIAIILSGTGSDGMRGVRAVKEHGGMAMAQTAESAKFDGMPRAAISTGLADFVVAPQDMPEQLLGFVRHPYAATPGDEELNDANQDDIGRILSVVREKCKVDFSHYKENTILRRIQRRMSVNQIEDLQQYYHYLRSHPLETTTLFREMLIGVTRFFRDPQVFEELRDQVLGDLLTRERNREIRVWVAGCSTGEEAYTLAILLRETMEQVGVSHDVKIFATDVDRDAIVTAGNGIYPESIAADLDPNLLSKYFYRRESSFRVTRNLREMVVFAQHNLLRDPPFTHIDLISCRNLLIYLQPVLQRRVLETFNYSLDPHGILLLGTSETVGEMGSVFEPVHVTHKIYTSKGRSSTMPHPEQDRMLGEVQRRMARFRGGPGATLPAGRPLHDDHVIERFLNTASRHFLPLALVVNESMEVLHVIGDSSNLFKLPSGRIQNDVSKMATRDLAIPLATGIQRVFRTEKEFVFTNIKVRSGEQENRYNLRIFPMDAKKHEEALAAVFIMPAETEEARSKAISADSTDYDINSEAQLHIQDLEQELQFTRENLQATIEELETSNEELQATNEELLASNEELQSTNEELQSTNEELHTVNAEYQNKIIELTQVNLDVDNLLSDSRIGTLLLDENLDIRRYSSEITHVFRIIESDLHRPLAHLKHLLVDINPLAKAREVQESDEPVEEVVQNEEGTWFLMRIHPYRVGPGAFAGVVMSFIDITRQKAAEQSLRRATDVLDRAFSQAGLAWWDWHRDTDTVYYSPLKAQLVGETTESMGSSLQTWLDRVHPDDYEPLMQTMRDHLAGKRPAYDAVYRLKHHDGDYRHFRDYGEVVEWDPEGSPKRLIGTIRLVDEDELEGF